MNSLFSGQNSSIRRISSNRAEQKATYRFLENEKVTEQELIKICCERTSELCKGRNLLVLNDSTEINLERHSGRIQSESGVGLVGNNKDIGFFAHLGLVVDVDLYQTIGFSSMNLWHREFDKGTKDSRGVKKLPIEKKESFKWIQCVNDSKTILKDAESITVVGDRESDIYELFTDARQKNVHVLARSRADRKASESKKIYDMLDYTDVCGSYQININGNKRKETKKREVTLNVKFTEAYIQKPEKKKDGRLDEIKIWVVEAKETNKVAGAICWRLLTTHPITSYEEAVQMVEWYQMRWFIEQVFRLLKNKGFQIEDSQLENGWALRKLTILLLQNVLRIMQMLIAYGSSSEEEDAGLVFSEQEVDCLRVLNNRCEGKTKKMKNPYKPTTIKWATWIIARLGGWSGYKSQSPPGPITLKNGLDKFNHVFIGWCIATDVGTR